MHLKEILREYKSYTKERVKKVILLGVIGFYFLFLFFYNLHRQYGVSAELSWLNGIIAALITTLIYLLLFTFIGFFLKAELIKGRIKNSLILAIIGAAMLLFAGIVGANNLAIRIIMIVEPSVFLAFFMPLILSIIGLLGIILVFIGKKYGTYFIIIAGLIAIIGMFITIYRDLVNTIPLVLTLIYIDPFLLLIGGVLGLALKE